jgi:hypothetical protein
MQDADLTQAPAPSEDLPLTNTVVAKVQDGARSPSSCLRAWRDAAPGSSSSVCDAYVAAIGAASTGAASDGVAATDTVAAGGVSAIGVSTSGVSAGAGSTSGLSAGGLSTGGVSATAAASLGGVSATNEPGTPRCSRATQPVASAY